MHSEKLMTWLRKLRRVSKTRAAVPQPPVFLAREESLITMDSAIQAVGHGAGIWTAALGGGGGGAGRHL